MPVGPLIVAQRVRVEPGAEEAIGLNQLGLGERELDQVDRPAGPRRAQLVLVAGQQALVQRQQGVRGGRCNIGSGHRLSVSHRGRV